MTTARRIGVVIAFAIAALVAARVPIDAQNTSLPAQLTDAEFWALTTTLSESGGTFVSDNLVSNEMGFQKVLPALAERQAPGGVYMGVGPEQNFTYIAALRPRIAFIVDIRRGNRDLHLMYKALFELARDRGEFVSLLFSRPRPDGLTTTSSASDILAAFTNAPPSDDLYRANLARVIARLTTTHRLPLSQAELADIEAIYAAFFRIGPEISYGVSLNRGNAPASGIFAVAATFENLMQATDANDTASSFLASEARFSVVKELQAKNLVIPLVGDFAGSWALRGIGHWLRARAATVSAFYLSNVEDYLRRAGTWNTFCQNVVTLPADASSEFIWSGSGGPAITPDRPLPTPDTPPVIVKFEPGPAPKTVIVVRGDNATRVMFVEDWSVMRKALEAAEAAEAKNSVPTRFVPPPNRAGSLLDATKPCR